MAYIKKRYIRWDPPVRSDITMHRVFVAKETETLDMGSAMAEIPMPALEAVCPDDFPDGTFDDDTANYKVGIVAFDGQGNYSDMEVLAPYPFDFIPPAMPTGGRVE